MIEQLNFSLTLKEINPKNIIPKIEIKQKKAICQICTYST